MKALLRCFFVFLALSILGSIPVSAAPDATSNKLLPSFKQYQNAKHQLQISYPATWSMKEAYMGTVVVFSAPPDSSDDQFAENINIVTEDLSRFPGMTIEQYVEHGKITLSKIATDFILISNQPITIANIKARVLTFTATQGIYKLQFRQTSLIVNNMAYVITFTAEEDKFSQYESIAKSITNSFTIQTSASVPSI